AHEAATRRHGVGTEAFARRVEADERVRRRAGDPDIARLTVRVERVGLLGVAVTRWPGDPGRERVDLPALDRGIEAAEDARAVARHPEDAVRTGAQTARSVERRLPHDDGAGRRVEAPDPLSEELREPYLPVGRDVAAVGHREGEPDLGGIARRERVVGELGGHRIEACEVVRLGEREPYLAVGVEAERVRIRALVVADPGEGIV